MPAFTAISRRQVNGGDEAEALLTPGVSPAPAGHEGPAVPSAWTQIKGCCSSPIFMATCLGYAVYSGVIAGLGFYGPLYIQTNRPCDARWNFKLVPGNWLKSTHPLSSLVVV